MANKTQKENRGRTITEDIVSAQAPHDWQESNARVDDGFDGVIYFKENNEKTGEQCYVQIKCGEPGGYYKEYKKRPNHFGVLLTEEYIQKHRDRWSKVKGPMILVYVDYASSKAWWTDLRDKDSFTSENKNIVLIEKRKEFTTKSFDELRALYRINFHYDNFYYSNKVEIEELNEKLIEKSVENALVALKRNFDPIFVIPNHILENLFPFKINNTRAQFKGTDVISQNKELYKFLDNIYVSNNKLEFKSPPTSSIKTIQKALIFLKNNDVRHLHQNLYGRGRICVHSLFSYYSCLCFKCSIGKLNYKNSINYYLGKGKTKNLQYAYSLFVMGLYEESFFEFYKCSERFEKSNNRIGSFIANYNLSKLSKYITRYCSTKNLAKVETIKKKIKIDSEKLKPNLSKEQYDIVQWIANEAYINDEIFSIDTQVQEILHDFELDRYGDNSRYGDPFTLKDNLSKLTAFIHGNNLVFSDYREYHHVILKSLEGILASYCTNKISSQKIEYIDDDLVILILNYLSVEDILFLLNKYQIKTLKYKTKKHEQDWSFVEIIENFRDSIDSINKFLLKKKETKSLVFFQTKLRRQVSNAILLLSYLDLNDNDFNRTCDNLVEILFNGDFIMKTNFDELNALIISDGGRLNDSLVRKIRRLRKEFKRYWFLRDTSDSHLLKLLPKTKSIEKELDKKIDLFKQEKSSWEYVQKFITSYSTQQKGKLKTIIKKQLKTKYNFWFHYSAILNNMCEFKLYEKEALAEIPIKVGEFKFPVKYLNSGVYNRRLNMFIEIAFKENINLSAKKYEQVREGNLYYAWLFDLNKFDYSKFNPLWILIYKSEIYFSKFKKNKYIKNKVKEYLEEKSHLGLSEIYFKCF